MRCWSSKDAERWRVVADIGFPTALRISASPPASSDARCSSRTGRSDGWIGTARCLWPLPHTLSDARSALRSVTLNPRRFRSAQSCEGQQADDEALLGAATGGEERRHVRRGCELGERSRATWPVEVCGGVPGDDALSVEVPEEGGESVDEALDGGRGKVRQRGDAHLKGACGQLADILRPIRLFQQACHPAVVRPVRLNGAR